MFCTTRLFADSLVLLKIPKQFKLSFDSKKKVTGADHRPLEFPLQDSQVTTGEN